MKNVAQLICLALVLMFCAASCDGCQPCEDPSQIFCAD